MDYLSLVKNSNGTKETMWKSVEHISGLLKEMKEAHPELVRKFMEEEYALKPISLLKEASLMASANTPKAKSPSEWPKLSFMLFSPSISIPMMAIVLFSV